MADDFQTGAELEVKVTESSLRAARRTIEEELGDIEVEVTASVAGGGSGGAVGHRGPESPIIDLSRRQLNELELMRAEELEPMVELLRSIDDDIGQGGGGGGGGGLLQGGLLLRAGQMTGGGGGGGLLGGLFGGGLLARGAGLLGAARLGGGAFSPGIFGKGSAVGEDEKLLSDPISQAIMTGMEKGYNNTFGEGPVFELPDDFPPELKFEYPEDKPPLLRYPEEPPPEVEVPDDITLPFEEGPALEIGGDAVDLQALGGDPFGEGALDWTNLLGAPSGREGRRQFAQQEFSTSVDVTQTINVEGSMQEAVDEAREEARKEADSKVDEAIDNLIDVINRQTGLNLSL